MTVTTVALLGNPNCGKTTLFNILTGGKQRVGNWPGVTVERKSGFLKQDKKIEIVDLPGTYSLVTASASASIDERIACHYILNDKPDVLINILDASHLERNLYLTLQLMEVGVPVIVVLNMMDVAEKRQVHISVADLEKELGCPVVAIEAHKKKGIEELVRVIGLSASQVRLPKKVNMLRFADPMIVSIVESLAKAVSLVLPEKSETESTCFAIRLLESDVFAESLVPETIKQQVLHHQQQIRENLAEEADILLADARYQTIHDIISKTMTKSSVTTRTWTERIDSIILNRILGIPIFLCVMYLLFLFAINIGGVFQDFFDIASNTIFVGGLARVLTAIHSPNWLTALLANGVGRGISTTVTFIPVIGAMFLCLALLEDSGYMARAAFVVDRGMRALGLPGKSFVPMIIGFGCNVPAVMATRTLDNKRDRILTVMMSPFMSCGARLAIYAVFTAAFFPVGGQNIVFALYFIGVTMAVLTGLLLRKTLLKGEPSPLIMELPPYHFPRLKTLLLQAKERLKSFVLRAGKLIIPICVLIGALGSLSVEGHLLSSAGDEQSLLSAIGRFFTPIFSPMGIHQDNWPATVGLMTGVLAKEVVIGTLNALYTQVGHLTALKASGFDFWNGLQTAVMSIPQHISQLGGALGNPVLAQAPVHTLSQSVYGEMYRRFDGQVGAMAYLLFVLLYFPCVSTTAAMLRELNRAWTLFSVVWTTGIAYCVAVAFYQAVTFSDHPVSSFAWLFGIFSVLVLTVLAIKLSAPKGKRQTLQTSGAVI